MLAGMDCVPCSLKQALRIGREAGASEAQVEQILRLAMHRMNAIDWKTAPSEISTVAVRAVNDVLGVKDPYSDQKKHYNQLALSIEPELQEMVDRSDDPLHTALLLAVAGNIIDLGILTEIDVEGTIRSVLSKGFAHNDYGIFTDLLDKAGTVLYIGDNAGEIVFDKLVLRLLGDKQVTFVVKAGPVINDACMEDAEATGIPDLANVITTGSDRLGAPPAFCGEEFNTALKSADIVVAKGQANFESIPPQSNLFYLLTAKCGAIADALGVKEREVVLRWAGRDTTSQG